MDDDVRRMHEDEQKLAEAADRLPALWRRLYENCEREGFTPHEALKLVQTFILSAGGGHV